MNLQGDECLFSYKEQFDVLKVVTKGQLVRDQLTPRKTVVGYCFDAVAGDAIRVEFAEIKGNISPLVSVSPFDNPTNFLGVGRNSLQEQVLTVGPINITVTGRYLLLIADEQTNRQEALNSDFALLVTNLAGNPLSSPGLGFDPVTGALVVNPVTTTPVSGVVTPIVPVVCPSLAFTCTQLTCSQAAACLAAGNFSLDPNGNGTACDEAAALCTPG